MNPHTARNHLKNLAVAVVLLGGFAAGCGSGGDVERVDDFIQQMATEQCAWEFRCCTDPEITRLDGRKFFDAAGCIPYRTLALQTTLYLHRLAASEGRLSVDGDQADACIAQLQAKACNPKTPMTPVMDPMAMRTRINGATWYHQVTQQPPHLSARTARSSSFWLAKLNTFSQQ